MHGGETFAMSFTTLRKVNKTKTKTITKWKSTSETTTTARLNFGSLIVILRNNLIMKPWELVLNLSEILLEIRKTDGICSACVIMIVLIIVIIVLIIDIIITTIIVIID